MRSLLATAVAFVALLVAPAFASADWSISPGSTDFGAVGVGSGTPARAFTVTNTGATAATVDSVSLKGTDPGEFRRFIAGCLNVTVSAGGTCTVSAAFVPTSEGAKSAVLRVTGAGARAEANLSGTGVSSSPITFDPASSDFGTVAVGRAAPPKTIVLTNTASAPVTINRVELAGGTPEQFSRFAAGCVGKTVAPGGTCSISVVFRPGQSGPLSAFLRVVTPGLVAFSGGFTGTGAVPFALTVDPPGWDFGDQHVSTTSPVRTFTITNSTGETKTIAHVDLAGDDTTSFVKFAGGCLNKTLVDGASCTFSVLFRPTSAGAKSAIVRVTPTVGVLTTVALGGTGTVG